VIPLDENFAETMWYSAILDTFFRVIPEAHENLGVLLECLLADLAPIGEHVVNGVTGEGGEGVDNERSWSADPSEASETAVNVCDFLAFPLN